MGLGQSMNKKNWKSVVLFYFLACLWSWPFFWWRDINSESWKALDIPNFLKTWSYMWGPGISALICLYIFRKSHDRQMTFRGTSLWRGLLFMLTLPVALAVVHLEPKYLAFGGLGFISILGEELGWRGFLQDALKLKSDYTKAIVIGILWELWHFTNRTVDGTLLNVIIRVSIFFAVLTITSFVILKLMKTTRSLFIPVAIHMAMDSAFEFDRGWQSVLLCIPVWALLYLNWIKSKELAVAK